MKVTFALALVVLLAASSVDALPKCFIPCPRNINPVCGSDGTNLVLYANECGMRVAACELGSTITEVDKATCSHLKNPFGRGN
uniref:Trypsin inhibitor n=1 Tax=Ciona intestinalis TaxID=7719 RepID=O97362_CIOIN|nr:trypsin inhibitor [Ciona intestinalis]